MPSHDVFSDVFRAIDVEAFMDCFVTIDAIGTQKDIMDKIKEKKGHFCLQLKRNQKNAFEDVELFFSDMEKNRSREFSEMDYYMQEEKNHGRIEKREYRVFTGQEEIKRVLDTKWGHVGCLGMAKLTRKSESTVSEEIHYRLLEVAVSAKKIRQPGKGTLEDCKQPPLGSGYPFQGRLLHGKYR